MAKDKIYRKEKQVFWGFVEPLLLKDAQKLITIISEEMRFSPQVWVKKQPRFADTWYSKIYETATFGLEWRKK